VVDGNLKLIISRSFPDSKAGQGLDRNKLNLVNVFPYQIQLSSSSIVLHPIRQSADVFSLTINNLSVNSKLFSEIFNPSDQIQAINLHQIPANNVRLFRHGWTGLIIFRLQLVYSNSPTVECLLISRKSPLKSNKLEILGIIPQAKVLYNSRCSYLYRRTVMMEATGYYPGPECTGESADGLTATGKIATYGIVAVDPKVIPLGTMLYVEGYGRAEAADVGGAIKGDRIDLCFRTYREALVYGRKRVRVYFLE
jgi:3D (Asp-Asp-Asp) domain-containing protein